jgi:hypothetical protein
VSLTYRDAALFIDGVKVGNVNSWSHARDCNAWDVTRPLPPLRQAPPARHPLLPLPKAHTMNPRSTFATFVLIAGLLAACGGAPPPEPITSEPDAGTVKVNQPLPHGCDVCEEPTAEASPAAGPPAAP